MTQAECVSGAIKLRVDLGSVDINKPLISIYPDSYTLHPKFDKNKFKNNIALLRLPEKLDFNRSNGKYSPVRLPSISQIDELFVNSEAYFTGFGYPSQRTYSFILEFFFVFTNFHSIKETIVFNGYIQRFSFPISDSYNVSERLLFARQTIIPNSACALHYGNDLELVSPQVVCSQSTHVGQGPCTGDAGAPLVINEYGTYTLVGLLSFNHNDGGCGRLPIPAVSTRLTSYFPWIENITGYKFRM